MEFTHRIKIKQQNIVRKQTKVLYYRVNINARGMSVFFVLFFTLKVFILFF